MAPFTPLYIDGQFRPSSTNESFEVRHPLSKDVVGISASASSQDCKAAVEAAATAFLTWEHKPLTEKRDIFIKAADIASGETFTKRVADASAEETGAVSAWGTGDCISGIRLLRSAACVVNELRGEIFPSTTAPGAQVLVQPRAMGVM
jgi:acyl-CoA reductase-like NAD-dependent aldehyde dehydrogenase